MTPNLLLIDDDEDVLDACRHLFTMAGYRVKATTAPEKALTILDRAWCGVVVSDIYMPAMNGLTLLEKVQEIDPAIPVIMMTGHGDIPLAVKAVKAGAFDFLEKPLDPPLLLELIRRAQEKRAAQVEMRRAVQDSVQHQLIGSSAQISTLREQVSQLAMTDQDVLLEGPLGSGRHTVARLLHDLGERRLCPLVTLDCSPQTTQERLLQGLQEAAGGTLVLRHLEHLPTELQRWLGGYLLDQERSGSKAVRSIALFELRPEQMVEQHKLTPELYYYLSQVRLRLPPLAERSSDIIPLFRAFLRESCRRLGKGVPTLERGYLDSLKHHDWPGNVRELRNVAELYAVGIVKLAGVERVVANGPLGPLDDLVEEYERKLIEDALYLFSGRVSEVADYLEIPRKKLYLRMKKYGLDKECFKPRG